MSFRFQFRRGTTAERNASNPILAAGEPAVVLDSGQPAELVLGDGVTAMADLRAAVWDDDARLALAGTATQPGDLGTAATADADDFATAAQGALTETVAARTPYALEEFASVVDSGGSFAVALAGDSTGEETPEWFVRMWDDYADARPELTEQYRAWDHATQAYPALTTRQAATGIVTRPVWDTFTRTAASLDTTSPERGAAWSGASSAFTVDGTAAVWAASSGYVRCDGTAPGTGKRTASGTVSLDLVAGAATKRINVGLQKPATNIERLSIYMGITAAGTIQWGIEGQLPGFATLVAGAGTPLVAGVQTVPWSLEVDGATVTATLNGVTATATLDAGQQASAHAMTGIYIAGTNTLSAAWKVPEVKVQVVDAATAPTLTVTNGSRAGADLTYQQDRIAAMFGTAAVGTIDALFISSSHNYGAATPETYLAAVEEFIAAYRVEQPTSAIVVVAQNPEALPAAYRTAHAARLAALRPWALANGYGYLDAYSAFIARPDWAEVLVRADGIHPTANNVSYDGVTDPDNGQYVWKEAALEWLGRVRT